MNHSRLTTNQRHLNQCSATFIAMFALTCTQFVSAQTYFIEGSSDIQPDSTNSRIVEGLDLRRYRNLSGTGSLTITAPEVSRFFGGQVLNGIVENSLDTSTFSGDIEVVYDRSSEELVVHTTELREARILNSNSKVIGINGSIENGFSGDLNVVAKGGRVELILDTRGQVILSGNLSSDTTSAATGIAGNYTGTFDGAIHLESYGGVYSLEILGDASVTTFFSASNLARGIDGNSIEITDFSGSIEVYNRPAWNELTPYLSGVSDTAAISARNKLYLNASGGLISAINLPPVGISVDEFGNNRVAYAISSGAADDEGYSRNLQIIGNVDLGEGSNIFYVEGGHNSIDGDLQAQGGTNDFRIRSGLLQPIGKVTITDLDNNRALVEDGGGFRFALANSGSDFEQPEINLEGSLHTSDVGMLSLLPDVNQAVDDILGQEYTVIQVSDEIEGSFIEAPDSFFEFDVNTTKQTVSLTPTAIKGLQHPYAGLAMAQKRVANILSSSLPRQAGTGWNVYSRPYAEHGEQDTVGSASGFDWEIYGNELGVTKKLNDSILLRGGFSYSSINVDGLQGDVDSEADVYSLIFSGTMTKDTWTFDAGLMGGFSENSSSRNSQIGENYSAAFNSWYTGAWVSASKHYLHNTLGSFQPFFRTQHSVFSFDEYDEDSGFAPIRINDDSQQYTTIQIGTQHKIGYELGANRHFELRTTLSFHHQLSDDMIEGTASILGTNQTVAGPEISRSSFIGEISPRLYLQDSTNLSISLLMHEANNWSARRLEAAINHVF